MAKQMLTTATPENRDAAKSALKTSEQTLKAMKGVFDKLNSTYKKTQKENEAGRQEEMRGAENILTGAGQVGMGLEQRKSALDAAKKAYEKDPGNDFKYNQYLHAQDVYSTFLEKNKPAIDNAKRIQAQGDEYKTIPDVGPSKYVGPAGGESTMARTYDPFAMIARKALEAKGQAAIDKAGYTPFMVDLAKYLQGLNTTKGK